jgi:hypothetical protein
MAKKTEGSGGGPGCLVTTTCWVVLLGLIGWAGYDMEPKEAALWGLWTTAYGCAGGAGIVVLFIVAYVGFNMLWQWEEGD